jgi:predicted O-methyltransferase YrrM
MLFKYVTAMSLDIFNDYGQEMLETFDKYWPEGDIWLYTEDFDTFKEMTDLPKRVVVCDLYKVEGAKKYLDTLSALPILRGEVITVQSAHKDYRRNIATFAKKALAQCDAACDHKGYLFWLDADIITGKHIPGSLLENMMLGHFISVMMRPSWGTLCSSFVGWDCAHAFSNDWFNHYYHTYMTGNVLTLPEWQDTYVLQTCIYNMEGVNDIAKGIDGEGPYNVFDDVFRGYAHHMKGRLKEEHNKNRYYQLLEIVKETQPSRFVEIGTWNGDRALEIHAVSPDTKYVGFDLFEGATDETDEIEKNVKAHYEVNEVEKKLKDVGMHATLYKGDTKETLPKYASGSQDADIVFVDGGHSIETIESDLKYAKQIVKKGGVIIMDDYYTDMPDEELEKYGAQAVLKDEEFAILPVADPVPGGGLVQMAVLRC